MKRSIAKIAIPLFAMLIWWQAPTIKAQTFDGPVPFHQRNLGGPRLGDLKSHEMDRLLSQFGWHFEYQVIPEGGGPQFVVQLVPMVAGVEYGKFIPSTTLAMGVRFPGGIEFGLGPNVMITGTSDSNPNSKAIKTSLIIGVGKSFNYGGVSIPLNFVFAESPEGNRVSFILGYAISRSKRR